MTFAQKNKDEEGKNIWKRNKKELKNDNNCDNNNVYNHSNRKGKALKLATKETLKIKNTSCLIFETLLP